MVAGAEQILARLIWENEVSKVYTPLGLGEVIATRSYDATGGVNKLAQKNKDKDILSFKRTDGEYLQMVSKENVVDPQSQELIKDALEANKWAYVFADYASDLVVDRWFEQFKKNLRTKRHPDLCKDLYEPTALKLMLLMLAGESFAEATDTIIAEREWWTEFSQEWRPATKRKWQEETGRNGRAKACACSRAPHGRQMREDGSCPLRRTGLIRAH